jgi:hypothetical protein
MNQKEYELIAGVIKQRIFNTKRLSKLGWTEKELNAGLAVLEDLTIFLAYELGRKYPKTFDREKFMKACGLEGGV